MFCLSILIISIIIIVYFLVLCACIRLYYYYYELLLTLSCHFMCVLSYSSFVVNKWPESNKVLFCSVLLGLRRVLDTVFGDLAHSHGETKE